MEAIKLETVIETDGVISVAELKAGERVEVIVLRHIPPRIKSYPLRGTPSRFDNPFDPAIPEDEWDSF